MNFDAIIQGVHDLIDEAVAAFPQDQSTLILAAAIYAMKEMSLECINNRPGKRLQ